MVRIGSHFSLLKEAQLFQKKKKIELRSKNEKLPQNRNIY